MNKSELQISDQKQTLSIENNDKEQFIESINKYCLDNDIEVTKLYKKLINGTGVVDYETSTKLVLYGLVDINYVGDENDRIITPHILVLNIFDRCFSPDIDINKDLKLTVFRYLMKTGANPDTKDLNNISFRDKLNNILNPNDESDKNYVILKRNGREVFEIINQELNEYDLNKGKTLNLLK